MRQAWEMWQWPNGALDFNPHFFNYPALYFYLQFLGQTIYLALNLLIGRYQTPEDMYRLFESDPTEIVLLARMINILFGLGSVWATYQLGRLLHTEQIGLLASAILALTPIPVHTSRIVLVDTPLLFFGILSLLQCAKIYRHNTPSTHLWAGLWIGLAGASKYTGALFGIPLIAVHILNTPSIQSLWHQKKHIAISIVTATSVFLITNPYLLLDFKTFWTDFSFERTHMALGHFGIEPNRTVLTYLKDLWHNLGLTLTPFLIWGCIHNIKNVKSNIPAMPMFVFAVLYFSMISTWSMNAAHYLLPLFPPLAIATAMGIQRMLQHIKQSAPIPSIASILIIAPASFNTIQAHIDNAKPDTRIEAKQWIINNIPQQALIATEYYTPDLPPNQYHHFRLPIDTVRPELVSPFYDIGWYTNFGYIITSDGISARYQKDPQKFSNQIRFYDALQNTWQQVASFSGEQFSGPAIYVFKNANPSHSQFTAKQYEQLLGANVQVATDLLNQLANLFAQKEWYDKAIDVYIHLRTIAPDRTDTKTQLGFLFYQTGQIDKATQMWQQTLQVEPQNLAILTNLGAIYLQQGKTQQAVQYWERGLQQAPTDRDLINNLIYIYRQNNQLDRAKQILQNALQITPNDSTLLSALKALQTP